MKLAWVCPTAAFPALWPASSTSKRTLDLHTLLQLKLCSGLRNQSLHDRTAEARSWSGHARCATATRGLLKQQPAGLNEKARGGEVCDVLAEGEHRLEHRLLAAARVTHGAPRVDH